MGEEVCDQFITLHICFSLLLALFPCSGIGFLSGDTVLRGKIAPVWILHDPQWSGISTCFCGYVLREMQCGYPPQHDAVRGLQWLLAAQGSSWVSGRQSTSPEEEKDSIHISNNILTYTCILFRDWIGQCINF